MKLALMKLSTEEQVSKFTSCEESLERAVKTQILNESLKKKKTMIQRT